MWRMDLDTAKFLSGYLAGGGKEIELAECPDCGASYYKPLGHSCDNIIDLVTEEDKKKTK